MKHCASHPSRKCINKLWNLVIHQNATRGNWMWTVYLLAVQGTPQNTCTSMFIAALFIVAKKWKNPNFHQPMNVAKTEILLSQKKKKMNEVLIQAAMWMNLENITLGERSQTTEVTERMTHSCASRASQTAGPGSSAQSQGAAPGAGDGRRGVRCRLHSAGCTALGTS